MRKHGDERTQRPLARLVRARRAALGLTQDELAELVGVTGAYIGSIEGGKTDIPGPEVMAALSRALHLPESELLQAVGYLTTMGDITREMRDAEIRRISALPTVEEQLDALTQLSPELADLVESAVGSLVHQVIELRRASARRAPGDGPRDQPRNGSHTDRDR